MKNKSLIRLVIVGLAVIVGMKLISVYLIDFNQLIDLATKFYGGYGWLILLVAGFLEAIVLLDLYFPGSTLILLGATLSSSGEISFAAVIFFAMLGMLFGYSVSYLIGYLGGPGLIRKLKIENQVSGYQKHLATNKRMYFWATVHPDIASFLAVAAGMVKINFLQFIVLILIAQLIWSLIWGVIFYVFGFYLLKQVMVFVVIAVVAIIIFEIIKHYRGVKNAKRRY